MSIMDLSKYIAEEIIIDEIIRSNMPQIKGKNYYKVINIFQKYGIPYKYQVVNIDDLNPVQSDIIPNKIDSIVKDIVSGKRVNPIFISSDYYIIDGHHRWLANKKLNKKKIGVIKIDYPKDVVLTLFNKIDNVINENSEIIKKIVVVFSGRFQPFHRGHYYSYNELVSKFGKNNVYIGTSNITNSKDSPFNFKEKKEIITKLFNIPGSKVVELKNPYRPIEILSRFDPKTTALIVAVGEKDKNRLGGNYYIPYPGRIIDVKENYLNHGYVYIIPQLMLRIKDKIISGTVIRNNFSKELFKALYPKFDNSIYNMMKSKLLEGGAYSDDYIICKECGKKVKQITTNHLLFHHNMRIKEYKEKYPGAPLQCNSIKLVGENNPSKIPEVIDKIKSSLKGRNLGFGAPGHKNKHSQETLIKLSENNGMNKKEYRDKVSIGVKESYNKKPELRQLRSEQFKDEQVRNKIKETNYSNGNWKRPENKPEYINYLDKVRTITKENYNKYFYEIPNAKKRSREFHLDHKYSIHSGFLNNIPPEVIGHYKNLEILQHSLNESKFNKNSITLEQLILDIQNSKNPLSNKILLLCGGAYGHLNHPFEDMNLTFGDIKNIINLALEGKLELTQEKTDGQNLLFSWIDGKLKAARNSSHLKNYGKAALDMQGITSMFSGRGEISNAFTKAFADLESAISKLPNKEKIFQNGKKFMSVEIIYPQTQNIIPYGYNALIFHGINEYDEKGNLISIDKASAKTLSDIINKINNNIQTTFKIMGPNDVILPKVTDFSNKKSYFLNKLNKLQSQFNLKDSDQVILYHQRWWEEFIKNNSKSFNYTITDDILNSLIKRWAYKDTSNRINDILKRINNEKFREWVRDFDKNKYKDQFKNNIQPFELLFLELGATILKNINSLLVSNPSTAIENIKKNLTTAINQIESSSDINNINRLKSELEKLNSIGGIESIIPSEGITFMYKNKLYKLTGTFAPINKIIGMLKYKR